MAAGPDDPFHAIGRVEQSVPTLCLIEDLLRASRREEILFGRRDQPGLGSEQFDVVWLIEPCGEKPGNTLLRVPYRSGKQRLKRIHVAGHRGDLDARIERGDVGGLRAAAGTSRRADSFWIHLRTSHEIVD